MSTVTDAIEAAAKVYFGKQWIPEVSPAAAFEAGYQAALAAAARPAPQAGEVANIIADLKREASYWDGESDTHQVLCEAADLLTAQAAEIERLKGPTPKLGGFKALSGDVESRRVLKIHFDHDVSDSDRRALVALINEDRAQAAALAAKDEEIATLKSDLKRETDRYAALVASDSDTLTVQNERIAELEAALRRVTACLDTFIRETDDPGSEALAAVHCARAARQATKKPKPARAMADVELQNDFTDHCQRWDKAVADRDGHSGSPGEWIVERLDELRTEAKRRGLALVEPPAPAGKEEKP